MDILPREILLNIASRLPAMSLVQFKCVCRAWKNIIKDPQLIGMHFFRAVTSDPCLILHSDYPNQNQLKVVDLSSCDEPSNKATENIHLPIYPEFEVVGSCNGLLCLGDSSSSSIGIYICNPLSKTFLELPKSSEDQEKVLGFGFHPTTKEYKVVKAVYCSDFQVDLLNPRQLEMPRSDLQTFTLGNLTWRSLGEVPYLIRVGRTPSQLLFNGRLHWSNLISFDLLDERWRELPRPSCCGSSWHGYELVVNRKCLCAASFCSNGIDIWVMEKYGVKESWLKEFKIGTYVPRGLEQELDPSFNISKFYLNSGFVRVDCFLKNGEVLLQYECRALVAYDPKWKTFKDLSFQGMPSIFETIVHVGSLTWFDSTIDF